MHGALQLVPICIYAAYCLVKHMKNCYVLPSLIAFMLPSIFCLRFYYLSRLWNVFSCFCGIISSYHLQQTSESYSASLNCLYWFLVMVKFSNRRSKVSIANDFWHFNNLKPSGYHTDGQVQYLKILLLFAHKCGFRNKSDYFRTQH
jgi:hypothetical protein